MYLLMHAESISGNIKKKPGGALVLWPWGELGTGALVLALKIPTWSLSCSPPLAMFLTHREWEYFFSWRNIISSGMCLWGYQACSAATGIQTREGVCLAVEERIAFPLMEPSNIEQIVEQ